MQFNVQCLTSGRYQAHVFLSLSALHLVQSIWKPSASFLGTSVGIPTTQATVTLPHPSGSTTQMLKTISVHCCFEAILELWEPILFPPEKPHYMSSKPFHTFGEFVASSILDIQTRLWVWGIHLASVEWPQQNAFHFFGIVNL